MKRSLALALALAAGTSACTSTKRESASLVTAVDRYRKAAMSAKAPLADALDAVPCTAPEVCAAKEACVGSSRPTVKGVALKAEVETALAALHGGKLTQDEAASLGLAQKLDQATQLLEEGQVRLSVCEARITALRLEYGL
jgi:hypothetical protein